MNGGSISPAASPFRPPLPTPNGAGTQAQASCTPHRGPARPHSLHVPGRPKAPRKLGPKDKAQKDGFRRPGKFQPEGVRGLKAAAAPARKTRGGWRGSNQGKRQPKLNPVRRGAVSAREHPEKGPAAPARRLGAAPRPRGAGSKGGGRQPATRLAGGRARRRSPPTPCPP